VWRSGGVIVGVYGSPVLRVLWGGVEVLHFNAGSCNGCDMEVIVALSSLDNVEGSEGAAVSRSRRVVVVVVTGAVTKKVAEVLKRVYEGIEGRKYVVAVGACAISGGVFRGSYSVVGGVDKVVPVDLYVPGCPPRPEAIVEGIRELVGGGMGRDDVFESSVEG